MENINKKLFWTEDQLEAMVAFEKYSLLGVWTKLGLNILELEQLGNSKKKTTLEESMINIFAIKADMRKQIYSYLSRFDPVGWLRVRDIETGYEKVQSVRFNSYLKILETKSFELPDVYFWPYNFETPDEYREFIKTRMSNLNMFNYQAK